MTGNGVSKFTLLASEFIIAMLIGAAGYGVFAQLLAFYLVTSSLLTAGINFGTIQIISGFEERKEFSEIKVLCFQLFLIFSLIGIFFGSALFLKSDYLTAKLFESNVNSELMPLMGFILPIGVLSQVMSGVFKGFRSFKSFLIVNGLFRNLMLFGLAVFGFFSSQLSLTHLIYTFCVGEIIGFLVGIFLLIKQISERTNTDRSEKNYFDFSIFKKVLTYSYILIFWSVFQTTAGRSQVLIAGFFLTDTDVGVFNLFLRFLMFFTFLQTAVNTTFGVEVAKMFHLKDENKMQQYYTRIANGLLYFCGFLLIGFAVGHFIITGPFGDTYQYFSFLILPLALSQLYNVSTGPAGQILVHTENQIDIALVALIGTVLQIGLSFLLLPIFGLYGAIGVESITIISLTSLRLYFMKKKTGVTPFSPKFLKIFGFLLLIAGTAFALSLTDFGKTLLFAVIQGIFFFSAFVFLLFKLNVITPDIKEQAMKALKLK